MRAANQLVVVTGGKSGIGQGCVNLFKAHGMGVIIWDIHASNEVKEEVHCDVSTAVSVEAAMQETILRFGVPRVVVHCAGIAPAEKIVGKEGPMPLAAFEHVIAVNLVGTFNVMRVMAAAMMTLEPLNDERGVIINTASIAAYEGQIGQAAYSASKGGVVSLTLPAARELAPAGIRVNTIAPGLIATPLLLNMPQQVQDNLAATIPFPKRFGYPEEFAALALHVIENPMINGEVIRLDGALRMQAR